MNDELNNLTRIGYHTYLHSLLDVCREDVSDVLRLLCKIIRDESQSHSHDHSSVDVGEGGAVVRRKDGVDWGRDSPYEATDEDDGYLKDDDEEEEVQDRHPHVLCLGKRALSTMTMRRETTETTTK